MLLVRMHVLYYMIYSSNIVLVPKVDSLASSQALKCMHSYPSP